MSEERAQDYASRWTPGAYLFVGWSLGILTCAVAAWFWVFLH